MMYISGDRANEVVDVFEASKVVDTHVIGRKAGKASALKMAFAAWTKGNSCSNQVTDLMLRRHI